MSNSPSPNRAIDNLLSIIRERVSSIVKTCGKLTLILFKSKKSRIIVLVTQHLLIKCSSRFFPLNKLYNFEGDSPRRY